MKTFLKKLTNKNTLEFAKFSNTLEKKTTNLELASNEFANLVLYAGQMILTNLAFIVQFIIFNLTILAHIFWALVGSVILVLVGLFNVVFILPFRVISQFKKIEKNEKNLEWTYKKMQAQPWNTKLKNDAAKLQREWDLLNAGGEMEEKKVRERHEQEDYESLNDDEKMFYKYHKEWSKQNQK